MSTEGFVLDAGLFIALERGDARAAALVQTWKRDGIPLATSAGVVAQVWRGGRGRQVPLALLLRHTTVVGIDEAVAKGLGRVLGATKTIDPIDAHIAAMARQRDWPVVTSDPDDLRKIDPKLRVGVV
jgi:predicted nucleic acid-binding protein